MTARTAFSSSSASRTGAFVRLLVCDKPSEIVTAAGAPTMHVWQPPAGDLLGCAIEYVRPLLDRARPVSVRAHAFWAGVVASRDLGAVDVIVLEFTRLARETGLTEGLGGAGKQDVAHLIRWGLLDLNPFYCKMESRR